MSRSSSSNNASKQNSSSQATKKQTKGGRKTMSFAEFVQGVLGFLEEIKAFLFDFGGIAQIFFDLLP